MFQLNGKIIFGLKLTNSRILNVCGNLLKLMFIVEFENCIYDDHIFELHWRDLRHNSFQKQSWLHGS